MLAPPDTDIMSYVWNCNGYVSHCTVFQSTGVCSMTFLSHYTEQFEHCCQCHRALRQHENVVIII